MFAKSNPSEPMIALKKNILDYFLNKGLITDVEHSNMLDAIGSSQLNINQPSPSKPSL